MKMSEILTESVINQKRDEIYILYTERKLTDNDNKQGIAQKSIVNNYKSMNLHKFCCTESNAFIQNSM